MAPLQFMIFLVASWLGRQQGEAIEYLRAENRVLRGRLGPKRLRFTDTERRLLAEKGRPLGRRRLAQVASLATPETILRWYREKVAAKYDGSLARPAAGRDRSRDDRVGQLLTIARENPSWGYTRLRGALTNLGLDLGRSTIARILKDNGIEPAPLRGKTLPWKTFLKAHLDAIAAADFFSVEVLTVGGLVRYLVLFVIELKTRRSPNLNAFAERFVRSTKQECLRHIVPLGERHLRQTVGEFVAHYHSERNHQGLGNVIPFPAPGPPDDSGPIRCRERLGGLLSFYERNAA